MHNYRNKLHSILSFVGKGIAATLVVSQAASLVAQEESANNELYELSPFTVDASDDRGYRANNTLTGSRLNTSLRDTAASVSVFTEEFLEDTGLNDMQEIARYSVGTKNDLQDITSGGDINNYLGAAVPVRRVRIRGIRATKGIDYFQSFIPDDSYRAGRYDESRGPNGILFGISEAGGVFNTALLRASTQKDSGRIRYSGGTYERNRADVKFNKVLVEDKLGIVAAGLWEDSGGWRDYEARTRDRYYGAITWKPTDRITFNANYEDGEHWETRIRPFLAADRFLPAFLVRNQFGVDSITYNVGRHSDFDDDPDLPAGLILDGRDPQENRSSNSERSQTNLRDLGLDTLVSRTQNRFIYNANGDYYYNASGIWESEGEWDGRSSVANILAANSLQDVLDAGGTGVSGKSRARILNYDQYGFPYPLHLNAAGPDMFRGEDFNTYSASVDFKLSESLFLNIAHNFQESQIDAEFVSGTEPELRLDPNRLQRHPRNDDIDPYASNPYAGQLYFDSYWRKQRHNVESEETRAALSYDLDFDESWLGRHRIAAGLSTRDTMQQFINHRWAFVGRPYNSDFMNSRNRVAIRKYITEGDTDTYVIASPPIHELEQSISVNVDGDDQEIGWIRDNSNTQNGRSDITVDSYILALQDYWFDGKLVTTFGYRKDSADNIGYGKDIDERWGRTLVTTGTAEEIKGASGYDEQGFDSITKTAGVVYHLNDNLSLIGNWANSIGLPEFRNIVYPNEGIPPPVQGEGYDVGIGFQALENKISGRFVYYDVESLNRTTSGGGTRIIADPLNQSMRALDQIRNDPDSGMMVLKADGTPYTDAEWEQEVDDLNGAVDGGVEPLSEVNAFLQDEFTEGYELSLTANITENWRLTFNASYTDRILLNYGREFAKAAGWQLGEDGRYIEPVSHRDYMTEAELAAVGDIADINWIDALAVDKSLYTEGSIYRRILDIADRVTGTFTNEDGDAVVLDGNGSLFINTDGDYDSDNPDETIAYRAWQSLSGDNNAYLQQNIDERTKRWGLNPLKFNVFTAYDFDEGMLKGFTVGGGYRWLEGAVIGEDPDGNEFQNSSEGLVDLLLRYRQKLNNGRNVDYQINVYNLLDKQLINPVRYSVLDDPTSPLSRYDLPTPQEVRATVTFSF